jgi:hypothetical protein
LRCATCFLRMQHPRACRREHHSGTLTLLSTWSILTPSSDTRQSRR